MTPALPAGTPDQGQPDVFFLIGETREGAVYASVGVWSGKAQIADGRIRFLNHAAPGLNSLDGATADDFIALLKSKISIYRPR